MDIKPKNGSPEFYNLLVKMADIHDRKSHDYAMASNPFSNFERSGQIASWFKNPVDISFATLIGVKLARLAELSNTDKTPNNESLDDTFLDLATYAALWAAYRKHIMLGEEPAQPGQIYKAPEDKSFPQFQGELTNLINKHNIDTQLKEFDFVIAKRITDYLATFEKTSPLKR